ncbi:MAG: hypothetical protein A2Z34_07105 [Planctomycetes bacterium RBG_16_59_8]|nr:MAG: hypothetical protein A2Z34_07105 [Planctomycetes bacterium RBG_16_59_8]
MGIRHASLFALLLSSLPFLTAASPDNTTRPVGINEIGKTFDVVTAYDIVSGRLTITRDELQVVLVNGMDQMLVNGKLTSIGERFAVVNGSVRFPGPARRILEQKEPAEAARRTERPKPSVPLPRKGFKVVIDPGHGGTHAENRSRTGIYEKEVNLDVSLQLRDLLEAAGIDVVMTRDGDYHLAPNVRDDLDKRVDIANREMPDLFLSIHTNRAENADARGFEIFIPRDDSSAVRKAKVEAMSRTEIARRMGRAEIRTSREADRLAEAVLDLNGQREKILAEAIHGKFRRGLETEDRGIKEAGFYVIKWSRAPAVLVELEFLSNPAGERDLARPAHRTKLSQLLAEAVLLYFKRFD